MNTEAKIHLIEQRLEATIQESFTFHKKVLALEEENNNFNSRVEQMEKTLVNLLNAQHNTQTALSALANETDKNLKHIKEAITELKNEKVIVDKQESFVDSLKRIFK